MMRAQTSKLRAPACLLAGGSPPASPALT